LVYFYLCEHLNHIKFIKMKSISKLNTCLSIHAGAYFVLSCFGFCSSSKGNSNSFEKDSKCLKNKKEKE